MSEKIFENSAVNRMREMAGMGGEADSNLVDPTTSPEPTPPRTKYDDAAYKQLANINKLLRTLESSLVQLSKELAHSQGADPDAEQVIVNLSSALFHAPKTKNAIAQFRAVVRKIDPRLESTNPTTEILPNSGTATPTKNPPAKKNTQQTVPKKPG